MGFYDVAMLIVLLGAVWFGFWKGLAWQIASLAAVVVSYFVAVNFRGQVSQFIQADEPWNKIGAMLILFLGTSIVIWMIYGRVKGSIKRMELKGFDRQAGALLGGLKGALLCMVATMFAVSLLGQKAHDAIHTSKLGPYVVSGIGKVSAIVPAELEPYVRPHIDNFHQKIGQPVQFDPNAQNPSGIAGGSIYPIGGNQQTPNNIPQSGYQSPPSQWQWQTPSTPTNQQPNAQYSQQYNQQQPATNWPQQNGPATYSGAGYQNGQQPNQNLNQFRNEANQIGQELRDGATQVFRDVLGERARQALEGGRR